MRRSEFGREPLGLLMAIIIKSAGINQQIYDINMLIIDIIIRWVYHLDLVT